MNPHLVMPMGGAGTRFFNNGYDCPKPLLQLHGNPFFYWATESVRNFMPLSGLTFVVLQEHVERYEINRVISSYYPEAHIVVLPQVLPGAVLTAMEGVKDLLSDTPVIFNDCDHFFVSSSFRRFLESDVHECDGALLTFQSNEPKYSFLECDEKGRVCRTAEKLVISNEAICGAYYFKNKAVFLDAAQRYLGNCSYNEYFMSGVYNELISSGGIVYAVPTDLHIPFGTPEELIAAEEDARMEYYNL